MPVLLIVSCVTFQKCTRFYKGKRVRGKRIRRKRARGKRIRGTRVTGSKNAFREIRSITKSKCATHTNNKKDGKRCKHSWRTDGHQYSSVYTGFGFSKNSGIIGLQVKVHFEKPNAPLVEPQRWCGSPLLIF
ncbi:PREDICTED: uncharacterized protein LOC105561719 [Vollenhovia emeryi]|uniref:uncharacterized protein LOC105561719 n=1 Tax=Vollenhovia emeryi TaxID=411798 RepID=UPI0005F485DE|nr:PREDICTED: uncharacterized protein LOC105561719 [Vollenhovia emeryi]